MEARHFDQLVRTDDRRFRQNEVRKIQLSETIDHRMVRKRIKLTSVAPTDWQGAVNRLFLDRSALS